MDPTLLPISRLAPSTVDIFFGLFFGIVIGATLGWWITRLYERSRTARLEAQNEANAQKNDWINYAHQALLQAFESLAAKSLRDNADEFSGLIGVQLTSQRDHFGFLKQSLDAELVKLDAHIRVLEQKREGAYQSLAQQVVQLQTAHSSLRDTTSQLVAALKSGPVRGRWGEIQLRRIIELAGMKEHVDFLEHVGGSGSGKPDAVVKLPNEGRIAIDSKFPLKAFFEAMEAQTDEVRKKKCGEHVAVLKETIVALSKKSYWKEFDPSPELTIMFIPIESCLMVAYEHDPEIIEFALERKIVLASPVTLLGYMKAIAYGWQQFTISKNARQILMQAKELYDRLLTWMDHYRRTGKQISSTAEAYNKSVASLESRFLPSCRRFQDLAAIAEAIEDPERITIGVNLPDPPPSDEEVAPTGDV